MSLTHVSGGMLPGWGVALHHESSRYKGSITGQESPFGPEPPRLERRSFRCPAPEGRDTGSSQKDVISCLWRAERRLDNQAGSPLYSGRAILLI